MHANALVATSRSRSDYGPAVVLLTTSLGVLIAQLDSSVVNLAAKHIGADLDLGVSALQWVIDGYNLVYASLLLTGGTLADLYGRRRMFALGIGLLIAGSIVCGLAPNGATLIAGRALTGLGAALELPTSLAILTVAYPDKKERAGALGIWASCNGLAFVIGPTVGGVLVDAGGWRSIFLLVVPLCLLALALAIRAVPESRDPKGRGLDLPDHSRLPGREHHRRIRLRPRRSGQVRRTGSARPVRAASLLGVARGCRPDDVRHVCDAVPYTALSPGRARRHGIHGRHRAAADVHRLRDRLAGIGLGGRSVRLTFRHDGRHELDGWRPLDARRHRRHDQPRLRRGRAARHRGRTRPQYGSGRRGRGRQRAAGAFRHRVRPRQHGAHDRRDARHRRARRTLCGLRGPGGAERSGFSARTARRLSGRRRRRAPRGGDRVRLYSAAQSEEEVIAALPAALL